MDDPYPTIIHHHSRTSPKFVCYKIILIQLHSIKERGIFQLHMLKMLNHSSKIPFLHFLHFLGSYIIFLIFRKEAQILMLTNFIIHHFITSFWSNPRLFNLLNCSSLSCGYFSMWFQHENLRSDNFMIVCWIKLSNTIPTIEQKYACVLHNLFLC